MNQDVCMGCGRHCPMNDLQCETGREYAKTGVVKKKHHHRECSEDERLARNLRHVSKWMHRGKDGQARVLMMLDHHEGMSQKHLTNRLELQPASVSELLAKLETAGLVVKSQSEEDRRTVNLYLTEEGKQAVQSAREEGKKKYEEMFRCLEESEKKQLNDLLEKLGSNWHHRDGNHERKRSKKEGMKD